MIILLASTILQVPTKEFTMENVPESVARYCAKAVRIPYASDNFTDMEWEQFKFCVSTEMDHKK
jgi:hypothetical protein